MTENAPETGEPEPGTYLQADNGADGAEPGSGCVVAIVAFSSPLAAASTFDWASPVMIAIAVAACVCLWIATGALFRSPMPWWHLLAIFASGVLTVIPFLYESPPSRGAGMDYGQPMSLLIGGMQCMSTLVLILAKSLRSRDA